MKTDTKTLKLKVSEALSKDVGRAYACMGPEDLARLGVEVGDIVEVTGKTKAVCKAMPDYKEMRGQSQIQLDGLTRENAGVGLDEHVQVRRISCPAAEKVVLVPTNVVPSERDMDYIGSRLDGLPVMAENRIRAVLFGARWADFKVESTVPKGPVLISPGTQLLISKLKSNEVAERANRLDMLDPAIIRPGRFDEIVEIPLPDEAGRADVLRIQLRNKPVSGEVSVPHLAARTDGYSGADISALCHQAAMRAIRRAVHLGDGPVGGHSKVNIEAADLEAALETMSR